MRVSGNTGVVLVVYYSRALNPPLPTSEDLLSAYFNVRHGIVAAALVYLGALPSLLQSLQKYIYCDVCYGPFKQALFRCCGCHPLFSRHSAFSRTAVCTAMGASLL